MPTYILSGDQPTRIPAGQGMRVIAQLQGSDGSRVSMRAISGGYPERPPHRVARMLGNGELFVYPPPPGCQTAVTITPVGAPNFPPGSTVVAELVTGAAGDRDPTQIQLTPISVGGFAELPLIRILGSADLLSVYGPTPPPPPLPPLAKAALEMGREWLAGPGRSSRSDRKITVVIDMSSSMTAVTEDVYAMLGILSGVCVAVGAGRTLSGVMAANEPRVASDIPVADLEAQMRHMALGVHPVVGMPFETALKCADREGKELVIVISDSLPAPTADADPDVAVLCLASDPVFSVLQRCSARNGLAVTPIGPSAAQLYLADAARLRAVVGRLIDGLFSVQAAR